MHSALSSCLSMIVFGKPASTFPDHAPVIAGRPGRPRSKKSNPPALARTATIVRNRRHVADRSDGEARSLQRTKRRFAAGTRSGHFNLQRAHAVFLRLLGDVLGRDLRGVGSGLARTLEA